MWYGSGAPFDSVLQIVTACSILAVLFVFPALESICRGFVTQSSSSNVETMKGVSMIKESWVSFKNVCHGLTGGILIQTRRNDV